MYNAGLMVLYMENTTCAASITAFCSMTDGRIPQRAYYLSEQKLIIKWEVVNGHATVKRCSHFTWEVGTLSSN